MDRRTTGGALPCAGAGRLYPARRHVRQQNWMKSFRSQSRLDLTISQNVSSAGFPQRRKEGQVRHGGQTWLLPAPHSGRQLSAVTPTETGGQSSEGRAGAEPGDEGGWGRIQVRVRVGLGRLWGHQATRGALRGHCSSFWMWEEEGSDLVGAGWGLLCDAGDAPVGEEGWREKRVHQGTRNG